MSEVTRSVGRYDIVREIGRGGMAIVYLARQIDLDREVALKQMAAFQGATPTLAQRFVRESRLSASLSHPNIVTVHDYFEHGGTPFIAMEYLPRGSLRTRIARLTLAQFGGLMEGLFAGLAHAETAGIVHRDLKPENLLVTNGGQIKIADFGIAKASGKLTTGPLLTATGAWVGTPAYMAPEQAMADQVGPQTDLYSVGIIAYELLSGQVPFSDDAPMAMLLRHINEPVPPVCDVNRGVDRGLSHWVDRLLSKAPAERTQSATEAWDGLEEILLRLLGPRWRREARLIERLAAPAPFESPGTATPPGRLRSFRFRRPRASLPAEPPRAARETGPAADAPEAKPAGEDRPPRQAFGGISRRESEALEPKVQEPQPGEKVPPGVSTGHGELPGSETTARPARPPSRPGRPSAAWPSPADAPAPDSEATVVPERVPEPQVARPRAGQATAAGTRPRPVRGTRRAGAVAGAALVASITGFLIANGQKENRETRPLLGSASNGLVSVRFPSDWRRRATPPSLEGLTFKDAPKPIALVPRSGGSSTGLVIGRTDASRPRLLPRSLIDRLPAPPRPQPVQLAGADAYAYPRLRPSGTNRRLTVFVVPTPAGVVTAACYAPRSLPAPSASTCDRAVSTLRVRGVQPFALGPSAEYARTISGVLSTLAEDRAGRVRRLAGAETQERQAQAARALTRLYADAARALNLPLRRLSPADRPTNETIVAALDRASEAYARLSAAASDGSTTAYDSARRAVRAAEQSVTTAVTNLDAGGYAVR